MLQTNEKLSKHFIFSSSLLDSSKKVHNIYFTVFNLHPLSIFYGTSCCNGSRSQSDLGFSRALEYAFELSKDFRMGSARIFIYLHSIYIFILVLVKLDKFKAFHYFIRLSLFIIYFYFAFFAFKNYGLFQLQRFALCLFCKIGSDIYVKPLLIRLIPSLPGGLA